MGLVVAAAFSDGPHSFNTEEEGKMKTLVIKVDPNILYTTTQH